VRQFIAHKLQVRNHELDSFGHVNHAVYMTYLEDARWTVLEMWGYSIQELQSRKWSIVATEARLVFRAPAFGRDSLEVRTRFGKVGRVRSEWKQQIIRPQDGIVILDALIVGVFLDQRGRPMRIPEDLHPMFMRYGDQE
jgi:YbgC/YbaW family acyl-CoA thioester hydrolase